MRSLRILVVAMVVAVPALSSASPIFSSDGPAGLSLLAVATPGGWGAYPAVNTAGNDELVVQVQPPFEIGKHNLGFCNPSGAVSMGNMNGNCYTMAHVARLFCEGARFEATVPSGRRSGFRMEELRGWLTGGASGPRFPVYGYESLYAMTNVPGMAGLAEWLEAATRGSLGMGGMPTTMGGPGAAQADDLVAMDQLVTAIHYTHYIQVVGPTFIEKVVGPLLAGASTHGGITLKSVERMNESLEKNRLPLICIFNPKDVFGHVVLAYKTVRPREGGHTDVYVYDSNEHHGGNLDETAFRVDDRTGLFEIWTKRRADGTMVSRGPLSGFWWCKQPGDVFLAVLPDPFLTSRDRNELAGKLEFTDEGAGYILA